MPVIRKIEYLSGNKNAFPVLRIPEMRFLFSPVLAEYRIEGGMFLCSYDPEITSYKIKNLLTPSRHEPERICQLPFRQMLSLTRKLISDIKQVSWLTDPHTASPSRKIGYAMAS